METTEKLYTMTEAAELLQVSTQTIRRAANRGQLRYVLTPGGWRRFPQSEIYKLAQQQKTKQPTPEV